MPILSPRIGTASKAAIIQLTKYFAIHLSDYNIRVNCISPGGVYNNQGEDFVKNYSNKVPMKRMGTPDDIAPLVTFLLSKFLPLILLKKNVLMTKGIIAK